MKGMAERLGFIFYPKDWWDSRVYDFELPEFRYIYLEITFKLYTHKNKYPFTIPSITRLTGIQISHEVYDKLTSKYFDVDKDGNWSSEKINKRLTKADSARKNGAKGGRPKKPKNPENETQHNPPLEGEEERESEKEIKREGEGSPQSLPISNNEIHAREKINCFLKGKATKILGLVEERGLPYSVPETIEKFINYWIGVGRGYKGKSEHKGIWSSLEFWIKNEDIPRQSAQPGESKYERANQVFNIFEKCTNRKVSESLRSGLQAKALQILKSGNSFEDVEKEFLKGARIASKWKDVATAIKEFDKLKAIVNV